MDNIKNNKKTKAFNILDLNSLDNEKIKDIIIELENIVNNNKILIDDLKTFINRWTDDNKENDPTSGGSSTGLPGETTGGAPPSSSSPGYTGAPTSKSNPLEKRGAPVTGTPSPETCQNTTMYENTENSKEAEEKLNELKNIVAKTKASIGKNSKNIAINKKNNKSLANVADGKDEDTGDACKKYPEAC